jgi:hypothetical protein
MAGVAGAAAAVDADRTLAAKALIAGKKRFALGVIVGIVIS